MARQTPPTGTGKLFWSGRSQAIRLPKEFRLSGYEVTIRRDGAKLVVEPKKEKVDAMGRSVGWLERVRANAVPDFKRPRDAPPQKRDWSWMRR